MILAILGRQPKIGLAELESLTSSATIKPIGDFAALVDGELDGQRLGGVTRLAAPLQELPTTDWHKLSRHILQLLPKIIADFPDGKIKLGLSVFGLNVGERQLFACGLDLKKACRSNGRSVRVVPNSTPELNSAQVIHNQLTTDLGFELLLIKNGGKTWLARTTWVQDIDAYAERDFGRPKRDAFVGMLPPKLAQTMLNLAGAQPGEVILDPFCGTGVVLQEAALLGCKTYGSDISEKMIEYSKENLAWLTENYSTQQPLLEVADATNHIWKTPIGRVVCETYLGQPLSGLPKPEKIREIAQNCDIIITKFLKNIYCQLQSGKRLCIAVPAWQKENSFYHLKLLDHLEDLGYNRVRFQYVSDADLIYYRKDQIVARQLLVITTK